MLSVTEIRNRVSARQEARQAAANKSGITPPGVFTVRIRTSPSLDRSANEGRTSPSLGETRETGGEPDILSAGSPTEHDLAMINALALRPVSADQVYVFDAVPSNTAQDSRFTRQDPSSIRNYAQDALKGVALMNSHRGSPTYSPEGLELPIGRTFYGEVRGNELDQELYARVYMLRDWQPNPRTANTDVLIRGIEAGTISDLSIGFRAGWYRCSVCGRDLFDRDCPHYPGMRYDGQRAYAWVMDGHMSEVSLVYAGATPGAGIIKAVRAVETGAIDAREVRALEELYEVRMSSATIWPVVDLSALKATNRPGDIRKGDKQSPEVGGESVLKGSEFVALVLKGLEGERAAKVQEAMKDLADDTLEAAAGRIASLLATPEPTTQITELAAKVSELTQRVAELEPLAEQGRQYRQDLIEQALKEGVRAFGQSFDQEFWTRTFGQMSVEDVKHLRAQWEGVTRERFGPGGRQTTPIPLDEAERRTVGATASVSQYKMTTR